MMARLFPRTAFPRITLALLLGLGGVALATPAITTLAITTLDARLPDGRVLQFQCMGSGSPTVLFEPGWAADGRAWRKLMPLLADETRLCAYDRAGSGGSDAGPLPRDGAAIARDLDEGLRAAGIAGPYVLVGHSAGGLYARHFALRRPHDVAGLVLADSSVAHQQARFAAQFGPGAGSLEPIMARARECLAAVRGQPAADAAPMPARCRTNPSEKAADRWATRLSELETLGGTTSTRLDAGEPHLKRIPLVVLTAGKAFAPPVLDVWAGYHREIAALSDCGTARVIPDSGHMMLFDRPDAIAEAVRTVIAQRGACEGSRQ